MKEGGVFLVGNGNIVAMGHIYTGGELNDPGHCLPGTWSGTGMAGYWVGLERGLCNSGI